MKILEYKFTCHIVDQVKAFSAKVIISNCRFWPAKISTSSLKRVRAILTKNLIQIAERMSGPCGFRPFHFHSILKIENQKFTISIFVAKKGKIKHHSPIF